MFCSDCGVAVETSTEVMPTLSWYLLEPGRSKGEECACMHKYRLHACTYICVHAFLKPTEYRLHTYQLYIHTSPPLLIFITHGLCYPRTFSYRYIMYTNHKPPSPLLCTPLCTLGCLHLCLLYKYSCPHVHISFHTSLLSTNIVL